MRHSAHYERTYGDDYYYGRRSYYSEPSYRSSYYDRPYRSSYYSSTYYDRPYRSYSNGYYGNGYSSSYYGRPYSGYSSYRYRDYDNGYGSYASYADSCYSYPRKIRVDDDRGGWVWGKRRCY